MIQTAQSTVSNLTTKISGTHVAELVYSTTTNLYNLVAVRGECLAGSQSSERYE